METRLKISSDMKRADTCPKQVHTRAAQATRAADPTQDKPRT